MKDKEDLLEDLLQDEGSFVDSKIKHRTKGKINIEKFTEEGEGAFLSSSQDTPDLKPAPEGLKNIEEIDLEDFLTQDD